MIAKNYRVETASVTVADGRTVYVERIIREPYRAERPSILFVNGALATTTSYRWAINMFDEYDMVFYDPPYVGKSRSQTDDRLDLSIELEVSVLAELNEMYQPDHMLSISWGGVVAIEFLAQQPANIKGAVLASLADRLTDPMIEYVSGVTVCLDDGRVLDAIDVFNNTIGKTLPRVVKRGHTRYFRSRSSDPAEVSYVRQLCRRLDTMDIPTMRERAGHIRCPSLLINGELDEYTPAMDAERLAALIPHSRCCVAEGVGHFLAVESDAAYRYLQREILDFFAECRSLPLGIVRVPVQMT